MQKVRHENTLCFRSYEVPLNCCLPRESRKVASRGLDRVESHCLTDAEFQWDEERVLEMNSGDNSTAQCVVDTTELCGQKC